MNPEYLDSDPSALSILPTVLLREEPDEDEEEEEDDREEEDEDDGDTDDGYSE
jgi:hypothetical protein